MDSSCWRLKNKYFTKILHGFVMPGYVGIILILAERDFRSTDPRFSIVEGQFIIVADPVSFRVKCPNAVLFEK
jgi:hypothetical protein